MKKIKFKYSKCFSNKNFLISLFYSVLFLLSALIINFYAGNYATEKASLPVTDIVLSNIRVFDVDVIFNYGPIFLIVFMFIIIFFEPKKLPFTIKSLSLFIVIRSIFISLTHIGPFPTQIIENGTNIISKFNYSGDLFFSGHTGTAFLMALIFWENIPLRYFLLSYSIFMGIVVLLGHYHYTIDVLAAFFITHTIYHIALFLFKKDKELFSLINN